MWAELIYPSPIRRPSWSTVGVASAFLYLTSSNRGLIPTRLQSVSEMAYEFVASTLRELAGSAGMKFFPFVFSLFMFVLVANMLGMFPISSR